MSILQGKLRNVSLTAGYKLIRKFSILKKTFFLFVSFTLLATLFLVSCQRELSFDNAGRGTAQYSFEGATGSCTGAVVSGSFIAGTAVTSANTVTLSVNVDSIGTYIISTNTVNGISFSGSGVFTTKGVQTITLTASGTPNAAGVYNFTPATGSCTFLVTVAASTGGAGGTAAYSLNGGTGACTGATVNGTFTTGTATTATNTVVLNITVTQAGTYNISTNTVNGIKFTGTGSFTIAGAQTVTLTASGTPSAAGTFTFTPGTNGCTFTVPVVAGGNPGGGGGSGSNFLRCKINGVLTNFNTNLAGLYVTPPNAGIPYSVAVHGKNSGVSNPIEEFWVTVSNPTPPTTGIYNNLTLSSNVTDRACMVTLYPTGFSNPYWGPDIFTANSISVNITSVSTSGAAGTFQGFLYENNGIGPAKKNITEGEFKITY